MTEPFDDEDEPGRLSAVRTATSMVWGAGRGLVVLTGVAMSVTAVVVALQLLVGRSILELLDDSERVTAGDLAPHILALGALMLLAALAQTVTNELRIPLAEKLERRALDDVLDVSAEVDYETFETPEFYDQLERAKEGAGEEASTIVFGLVTMASTTLVALSVTIVLLSVVPVLVPIAIVGYLPIAAVNVFNNRAMYRLEYGLTENERDRTYLEYVLTERDEAKEVRSFGLAPHLRARHGRLWETRLAMVWALMRRRVALSTVGSLISTAVLVGTLAFTLVLAGRGTISLGDAAVAIVGLQQLSGRLFSAGSAFSSVHESIIFLRDFELFRDQLPTVRRARSGEAPPSPPTALAVHGLGYRYPGSDQDALRGVDLTLERGQILAIVGANGSGKSTLAKLLCGLLSPSTGEIRWDDVDLADCDADLVRAEIAPVFQDYSMFRLELHEAIALGDAERIDDVEATERIARRIGLDDVVDRTDRGMQTRLGKMFTDGIDVSLGQWQRIAIARALFRDAPLLVFDEPSASLDPHAEADLFALLQGLADERMVIFISHRFATVRSADKVVVLDHGDLVEQGTHHELMTKDGLYADLFNIQASRFGA